jgi:threonine dehydrogenase-like Zn-dependent dehydrogenase
VVGDGAVGLCGVIAAKRLGAEQIIIMGRHSDRIALAKEFGATDVVSERGEEAVARVRELTGGFGAHWFSNASACANRPRRRSTSHAPAGRSAESAFPKTRRCPAPKPPSTETSPWAADPAPVRAYIDELLPDILEGRINPGNVFDRDVGLDEVPAGYRAMADRESIKVMVTP